MNVLFIDFETAYSTDKANRYDLKTMDICSYVRDPRFKVFGVGIVGNLVSYRPSYLDGTPTWVKAEEILGYFRMVSHNSDWKNITVVGHNIKFDGFILREKYGIVAGGYIDTMAMSRAVLGKTIKSHSLASLAEYFGLEAKGHLDTDGKTELTPEENRALAEYCLHDVDLCRQIYERLAPDFPENQYPVMDQTLRMFIDPKLQLNVPLLEKCAIEEATRRENIFKEIGINKSEFASNVKFPKLLQSKGFEVPTKESPRKKDDQGNPLQIPALALGDTEFLEMLESENEELKKLCEARVAAKSTLLETRSAKLAAIGRTGYWPFDVEFSGADQTHRFSGGSGAGGNPQNFTRGSALREAVEAPEGYELTVGDFANIELRLQAYLSKDPGLMGIIEAGRNAYCDFGSAFYGRTITKENKEEYHFSKIAVLGLGYGMGWQKFIKTVRVQTGKSIDEQTSRNAVDLYRTRYGQISALWLRLDNTIQHMRKGHVKRVSFIDTPVKIGEECLILPSGLKIRFPNLRQEIGERGHMEWMYDVYVKGHLEHRKLYGGKVLENICQGLAGELCKEAMLQMGEDVVGQVHDEILVLCKKGLGLMTAAKLKRAMTLSPSWMPQIKLDAEVKVGKNWLACK